MEIKINEINCGVIVKYLKKRLLYIQQAYVFYKIKCDKKL